MSLFFKNSFDPVAQRMWQNQIAQTPSRRNAFKKLCGFAVRLSDMHDCVADLPLAEFRFGAIDKLPYFLGELFVPLSRLCSGHLKRNREEALIITASITLKESLNLRGCCHRNRG